MKRPVKVGDRYTDCTNMVAVATEVYPCAYSWKQIVWYWLTRRAPDFDVIGEYTDKDQLSDPGRYSNVSWRHCGCEKI